MFDIYIYIHIRAGTLEAEKGQVFLVVLSLSLQYIAIVYLAAPEHSWQSPCSFKAPHSIAWTAVRAGTTPTPREAQPGWCHPGVAAQSQHLRRTRAREFAADVVEAKLRKVFPVQLLRRAGCVVEAKMVNCYSCFR